MVATLWGGNNSWLNVIGRPTISLSHGYSHFTLERLQCRSCSNTWAKRFGDSENKRSSKSNGWGLWWPAEASPIAFGMYLMISVELFFKAKLHCTSHKQQLYTSHWVVILCSSYWRLREQSLRPEGRKRRTVTVATSPTTISASSSVAMVACSGKPNGVKRGWRYRSKEFFLFYMVYHRWSAKCTSMTCFLLQYILQYAYNEKKLFPCEDARTDSHNSKL